MPRNAAEKDASGSMIGTAGWSIPPEYGPSFPNGVSHLERYSNVFSAVEINSSFHRPHRRTTYQRWAAMVPANFRFSVKIPRTISHTRRLLRTDDLLDEFLNQAAGLGDKLEILLLQLPPSLEFEATAAAAFLNTLRQRLPETVGIACEPRHATWFSTDAEACLTDHQVSRVAADPALIPSGDRPGGWAGLRYHRLHGSPRMYYSSYDALYLETLTELLAEESRPGVPRWCILDNTASGAATDNAKTLLSLVAARQDRS